MLIAPPEILAVRVRRLRESLAARDLDALVVTSLPNVAYVTGFFASAAVLVVTSESLALIGDGRYLTVLEARAAEWPAITPVLVETSSSYDEALVSVLTPLANSRVGVEAAHMSLQRHRSVVARLTTAGWTSAPIETDGMVEELRLVKDVWEVGRLRDGAARLSSVAKCILPKALAGRTESEVATELEAAIRGAGFERVAFDTIVAAGPNAALPHARPTSRRIEPGELVVVDFGGVLDGYVRT